MTTKTKKIIAIFSLVFLLNTFLLIDRARAVTVFDPTNYSGRLLEYIEELASAYFGEISALATDELNYNDILDRELVPALRKALIEIINNYVTEIYQSGNDGKPYFVTNWQEYLYKIPQDYASEYINEEFLIDTLSGGQCGGGASTSPYYDYLCEEAEKAIERTGIRTTLPEYLPSGMTDIDTGLFADGTLRAFNAYFECGNNPYCTTQETKALFEQVYSQKKEEAAKEASGEGALPQKNTDGTIAVPGKLYEFSINDAISLGNQAIVNAETFNELLESIAVNMMNDALTGQYFTGRGLDLLEIDPEFYIKYGL